MTLRSFISKRRCLYLIGLSIFFYCMGIGFIHNVGAEEINENQLYSKAAVLMDGKTGRVLYEKNGYKEMPMASTTKIMTCIIALENAQLNKKVTVSEYASSMPAVDLGMVEGEEYILKDLLYSLMLESHNDTAVAVAEGVSGNVEEFLKLMNEKAHELGCNNTLFLTPNGLDESITGENGKILTHHTTASDLARIMCYCINESEMKDEFLKITQTQSYSFTDSSGKRQFNCNNHNSLLTMMSGAISGKTGFTNAAGYCYVGALRSDNRDYVVALLACGWPNNKNYKWSDSKELLNYGMDTYSNKRISVPYKAVEYKVSNGQYDVETENTAKLTAMVHELNKPVLLSETEQADVVYEIMENISAPVKKGDKLGEIKYYIDDYLLFTGDIASECDIPVKNLSWAVNEILKIMF